MVFGLDPMAVQSLVLLAFVLVLERTLASLAGLLGAMKCCHAEVGGHVALHVANANPHAK